MDAKARAPQHDDQAAHAIAMGALAGRAYDGDDLLDPRRVGRVAKPLVARRTTREVAGQRRRRRAAAGGIEQLFL